MIGWCRQNSSRFRCPSPDFLNVFRELCCQITDLAARMGEPWYNIIGLETYPSLLMFMSIVAMGCKSAMCVLL